MKAGKLIGLYILWHYSKAFHGMRKLARDFIWFLGHFFSISLLLRTLFDPWKRLHEDKTRGLNFSDLFSRLVINSLMRLVGLVARLSVLFFGSAVILFFILLFICFFVIWIFLPLIIFGMIFLGFSYLLA